MYQSVRSWATNGVVSDDSPSRLYEDALENLMADNLPNVGFLEVAGGGHVPEETSPPTENVCTRRNALSLAGL